jgi:hypothetical protein
MLAARLEPVPGATPKRDHRQAAEAAKGDPDMLGDFLRSRSGQRLQREVIRGVFGMLKKRM